MLARQLVHYSKRSMPWDDSDLGVDQEPPRVLTREEVQALRVTLPPLTPWRVIAVQAAVGMFAGLLVWGITGRVHAVASMLYGASCVVLPGALLARGLSSPLSRLSPLASASSFVAWALIKMLATLVMLMLAGKIVHSPSWPWLLGGLVLCIKVQALAPWWHRPTTSRG